MRKGEMIRQEMMERWRTSISPHPITGDIYMISYIFIDV
jgi:hypothetical protein